MGTGLRFVCNLTKSVNGFLKQNFTYLWSSTSRDSLKSYSKLSRNIISYANRPMKWGMKWLQMRYNMKMMRDEMNVQLYPITLRFVQKHDKSSYNHSLFYIVAFLPFVIQMMLLSIAIAIANLTCYWFIYLQFSSFRSSLSNHNLFHLVESVIKSYTTFSVFDNVSFNALYEYFVPIVDVIQ